MVRISLVKTTGPHSCGWSLAKIRSVTRGGGEDEKEEEEKEEEEEE